MQVPHLIIAIERSSILLVAFLLLSLTLVLLLHYSMNIYDVVDNGNYDEKEQSLVITDDRSRVLMSSCSLEKNMMKK
jgi:hypothetical protein